MRAGVSSSWRGDASLGCAIASPAGRRALMWTGSGSRVGSGTSSCLGRGGGGGRSPMPASIPVPTSGQPVRPTSHLRVARSGRVIGAPSCPRRAYDCSVLEGECSLGDGGREGSGGGGVGGGEGEVVGSRQVGGSGHPGRAPSGRSRSGDLARAMETHHRWRRVDRYEGESLTEGGSGVGEGERSRQGTVSGSGGGGERCGRRSSGIGLRSEICGAQVVGESAESEEGADGAPPCGASPER